MACLPPLRRVCTATVFVVVLGLGLLASSPVSVAHSRSHAGGLIPNYVQCSQYDIVTLDHKTTRVGTNGTLAVTLYRRDDLFNGAVCSYYSVASETNGPSGTLTATIWQISCAGPLSKSVSSNGNASVQSPNASASKAPVKGQAKLNTTSVYTICTS
jgi:hypothetical protein